MDKNVTKIGKDVIESLTLGMYEDSRFIYREYIQNSADQIDQAVEDGLLGCLRDGKIEIDINCSTRSISIFDNATGIESSKVKSVLKNIAQSTKDRTKNKGFRGIGRLGGLAYCDKLIFETSFVGEPIKSTLVWDSLKLKAIINNRDAKEEATTVIDEVTFLDTDTEKEDSHYFKVTLEGVSNNTILNRNDIYQYLTTVAPVPFAKGFLFKDEILKKAKALDFAIDEYEIFVNKNQIFKSYTTSIYDGDRNNKKRIDEIHDIETYEIRTKKNKLLAWGWYSISSLKQQMPSINIARSLRLRKGNIQIGLEDALYKLFKEPRWSKYYFGEVYTVSSELIPNARRDYFLENSDLKEFEKHIKVKFNELQKLNYFSSKIRSEKKKIDEFIAFTKEFDEKTNKSGFTDNNEQIKYQEKFDLKKEKAIVAEKELEKVKIANSLPTQQKIFEKLVGKTESKVEKLTVNEENGKTKFITDDISRLNRKDRKLVSKILSVIDTVLMTELAENLKHKIIEELNK
jgi:hypothetical protein